ncbi:hypothetical protein ON010_g175 [Phytophthora cinnamomi]|nr:hypothetical protein ON010_g175 [Phytophthora cinnamomi]
MSPNRVLEQPVVLRIVARLRELHRPVVQREDARALQRLRRDGRGSPHACGSDLCNAGNGLDEIRSPCGQRERPLGSIHHLDLVEQVGGGVLLLVHDGGGCVGVELDVEVAQRGLEQAEVEDLGVGAGAAREVGEVVLVVEAVQDLAQQVAAGEVRLHVSHVRGQLQLMVEPAQQQVRHRGSSRASSCNAARGEGIQPRVAKLKPVVWHTSGEVIT